MPHHTELLDRITVSAGHCGGRPCIRGLRIRVSDVLALLSAGADLEEILENYPYLEEADVRACLKYASLQADHAILVAA